LSQPAPVARGTCGLSFLASAEGSYHHNSSSMGMLQSRHRDDIALAVCRDDLDRSNNAFPLLQVSKLVSRNRSCARSSGKVRLPTDTRLDRSGPTPAIDFRMPGAFPCDDMKLRASCRPGKHRVVLACRLHHPRYGNWRDVGVSSRSRVGDSLEGQRRHIGATHRADESRHRH